MLTQPSNPQSIVLPKQAEEETFYFEGEQPDLVAAPFVAPFQLSDAMPTVSTQAQPSRQQPQRTAGAAPAQKPIRQPQLSLKLVAILVCVVVIGGMLVVSALAQTTPPLQTRANGLSQTTQQQPGMSSQATGNQDKQSQKNGPQATTKPSPFPTTGTNKSKQTAPTSSDWVSQQLPNGWTDAGLSMGDGIQALRTAIAFNDREMSLDYRSVGTRNNHGGTFTASTFIMTQAAKQRFQHNDVRAMNNTLFDVVANKKLIRLVVDPQPRLIKFAQEGQQQFAWVDVAFQLWQSQINPNNQGQRIEGKDLDPASNQPRTHHMKVLLLRVPSQNLVDNPAMGGTGWLVSTYALDPANGTLPNIIQPA
jgi:hypothetical protein